MSGLTHRHASSSETTPTTTETSPTPEVDGTGPGGISKGGGTHTVVRGDTLWDIAATTYGHGRYWTHIRDANPGGVFEDGDLILVGTVLRLPVVLVPGDGDGADPEAPVVEAPEEEEGGEDPASDPTRRSTDFGNFLVYPDEFVGPLPVSEEEGWEAVREGEVDGIVAERRAAAEAERDQALSSIEELLSYDWNDWAITDEEATQALNLLAGLHFTQIPTAIERMGDTQVGRLLDNLPDGAKRTSAFARVVAAMGDDARSAWIQELLSYGIFDWAITNAEIDAICTLLDTLPPAEQLTTLLSLDVKFQARYATNLHEGANTDHTMLRGLFDALPDGETEALSALLGHRFGFDVRGDWDADGLRRSWDILETLPPDHVANNDLLDIYLQGGTQDGSGSYRGFDDRVKIEYSDVDHISGYGSILDEDGNDVGLHSRVNVFNTVVRHEIGHAVDAQIGASTGYATTAENAGRWIDHGGQAAWIDALIAEGGGMSGHDYPDEDAYESALRTAVTMGISFNDALAFLRAMPFSGVSSDVEDAADDVEGPVKGVLELNRWHPDSSPWYEDYPITVGSRTFHKAYSSGRWVSYESAARLSFGISGYQWRAPGEWFAEAYACYYSNHPDVDGQDVGTALRTRDSATADWFDTNVDQGHSLPTETDQESGTSEGTT